MTRRTLLAPAAITTIALLLICLSAERAHAQQGASLAVGAAMPTGDLASTASTGFDIQLQVRTEPLVGPLGLRIDIGYDRLSGKNGTASTTISAQSVGIIDNFGPMFYWVVGPGYYQSQQTAQILGHNVTDQRQYLGGLAALGMNVPVFRWEGFFEVAGVKLFTPGPTRMYVPLRFGMHL